jgi:hypothetical protein
MYLLRETSRKDVINIQFNKTLSWIFRSMTPGHSLKNRTSDRTGEAFGSRFTGWTAGSNWFNVGFLVVKIIFFSYKCFSI